jgi:hypothetical protein
VRAAAGKHAAFADGCGQRLQPCLRAAVASGSLHRSNGHGLPTMRVGGSC